MQQYIRLHAVHSPPLPILHPGHEMPTLRPFVITGVLACGACSGRSDEQRAWDDGIATTGGFLTMLQLTELSDEWTSDLSSARNSTAAEAEEVSCPDGGRIVRHTDDTLCFYDCELPDGVHNGTLIANDDDFRYEDYSIDDRGDVSTVDGGYSWDGEAVVMDLSGDSNDVGNDGQTHTEASARITHDEVNNTLSGTMDYVMEREFGGPIEIHCVFDAVPFDEYVRAIEKEDEAFMNRHCPQVWDDEVRVRLTLYNNFAEDEEPRVHFMLPDDESMDRSKSIRRGGSDTVSYDELRGEFPQVRAGRQGVVFATVDCPRATDLYGFHVAWSENGLFCWADGDPVPEGSGEE